MTLAKPNFVEMKDGQIEKLFCSVCGTQIAGMFEKPLDANRTKFAMRFMRLHNYAEAKFQHTDGNFHVTNGCWNCFKNMNIETAQEVYEADMAEQGVKADKQVVAIVAVDTSGSGLL